MEKDGTHQTTADRAEEEERKEDTKDDDSAAERSPEPSVLDATGQAGEPAIGTSSPSPLPVPEEGKGDGQNFRLDDQIIAKEKDAGPEEDDGSSKASPQSPLGQTMSEDKVEPNSNDDTMSPATGKGTEHSDLDITALHGEEPTVVEEDKGGRQNDRPDNETTVTASDAEPVEAGEATDEKKEPSPTHAQTALPAAMEANGDGQNTRVDEAEREEIDGRSGHAPQKPLGPSLQPRGEVSPTQTRYNLRSRGGGDGQNLTPDKTTAATRKDVEDDRRSKASPQRQKMSEDKKKVETLVSEVTGLPGDDGNSSRDTPPVSERPVHGPPEGATSNRLWIISVVIVGVAVVLGLLYTSHQGEPLPQKDGMQHINAFRKHMDKINTRFPNQRDELWRRSKIHLLRHLQTAHPTEPVSLILTADVRAKRTLLCLAKSLAAAFSSALNASFIYIDGASKASQDSDQVKLDIDSMLQGAFEGDRPVAVIHRFEELPPGSTLIFYRYCDHENAAYKKTFLIFTVLLGEEIPATSRLSAVEEMVDDHLRRKFLSAGLPVSFDTMDVDKYGGLWSRISHLILPVAAEARMEHEGCERTL